VYGNDFGGPDRPQPLGEPAAFRALLDQDIYLSGAILLMYSTLTILGTFLSDVLLAVLDPRIRYGERV